MLGPANTGVNSLTNQPNVNSEKKTSLAVSDGLRQHVTSWLGTQEIKFTMDTGAATLIIPKSYLTRVVIHKQISQ